MKIVAVTNQKGGVGKTTSSYNFVHMASEICAADPDALVGVIDFCGQGNLSSFLTGDYQINKEAGGAELLFESEQPVFRDTMLDNVKLLHGHRDLEYLDTDPETLLQKAVAMREWLRELPFKYLIIDTPPALGPRIAAPLIWADLVIVVIEPHVSSLTALEDTFETIEEVHDFNPDLEVRIVANQVVKAAKMHKEVLASLDEKFGSMIDDKLALRTAIAEACQNHLPVWKQSKDKKLKQQWREFAIRALA